MGLLIELQQRIPDRWFLRRLVPAALFVVVAAVGAGQLGHRHGGDLGLARERIAALLTWGDGMPAGTGASLVLFAAASVAAAFAVPLASGAVGALAAGAWPWWLMPLSRRVTAWRVRRWAPPREIAREAVRARAAGRGFRADRLDARRARTGTEEPASPTWAGDRFRETEARIRTETGVEITAEWTRLLLVAPEASRAALSEARDGYDAACEALAWSAAVMLLAAWWWPAAPVGVVLWLASWQALRRAVRVLCGTTEAVLTTLE
ncbi:hypothetical protein ACFVUW_26185 [Streptomyces xiamenensis]|uniref:hypothetical protein n=1 Tax=Streptomyces xiamenensis TaxID=408015 RepID=UPI0036E6B332